MKYLESALLALIAVFTPIQAALATTLALIIIDLATGIIASYRRSEKITSSGLKRTVGKILLYNLAICTAFLVQTYLTGDILPVSKLVTALIGLVELKSVLENLDSISGTSLFKVLVAKIVQSESDIGKK